MKQHKRKYTHETHWMELWIKAYQGRLFEGLEQQQTKGETMGMIDLDDLCECCRRKIRAKLLVQEYLQNRSDLRLNNLIPTRRDHLIKRQQELKQTPAVQEFLKSAE